VHASCGNRPGIETVNKELRGVLLLGSVSQACTFFCGNRPGIETVNKELRGVLLLGSVSQACTS
jgi:hypothetical protein